MRSGLTVLLLILALGCGDERSRPEPFGVQPSIQLSVRLLTPNTNETVLAGSRAVVTVLAREESGQLRGIGFVARRPIGALSATLDSVLLRLPPSEEQFLEFGFNVPADLAQGAQIDIYGLALGPDDAALESEPRSVLAIRCTAGPACP